MNAPSIRQYVAAQEKWIDRHYEFLKEVYLRRGMETKIKFPNFCAQMFLKNYLEWLESKENQKQDEYVNEDF